MGYIKETVDQLINSVTGLNDPSAGSTDVIVIRDENGNYSATPFNIRFPSQPNIKFEDRHVEFYVNGTKTNLLMKVSNKGTALFEKEMKKNTKSTFYRILKSMKIKEEENIELENFPKETENKMEKNGLKAEEFEKIRKDNFRKRFFFKNFFGPFSNFYNQKIKKDSMKIFLESEENVNFIFENSKFLIYYLNERLFTAPTQKKCTSFLKTFEPCKNIKVLYSDCLDKKLLSSPMEIFEENKLFECSTLKGKAICIKTCERCNTQFMMTFEFFSELYFYTLHLKKKRKINKKMYFSEFLRKKLYETKNMPFEHQQLFFSKNLHNADLKKLNLKIGKNEASFLLKKLRIEISIFCWESSDKLIISDFDGTVTKSDLVGHLYGMMNKDYTQLGIAELYTRIFKNGYRFLYLSSRPMSFYQTTKAYIDRIEQNGYRMPEGPILLSSYNIFSSIYKEVVLKKPHVFKIACLLDVSGLFGQKNPFVAGFGNKKTDEISYKAVDIPDSSIYLIDTKGMLSIGTVKKIHTKYSTLQHYVNAVFPKKGESLDLSEFNDYLFWK